MKFIALLCLTLLISCASQEKKMSDAESKTQNISAAGSKAAADAKNTGEGMKKAAMEFKPGDVKCVLEKDERVISTAKAGENGCEVMYTKNGETNSIATAANDASYCNRVVERMKNNLATAGFQCSGGEEKTEESKTN